ncbi:hypothetical protein H1R20_g10675, partial [Candolleomyces eurysporus]
MNRSSSMEDCQCRPIHDPKPKMVTVNAQPIVSPGNDADALHNLARYDPTKWDEYTRAEVSSEDRDDATPDFLSTPAEKWTPQLSDLKPKWVRVNAQPSVSPGNDANTLVYGMAQYGVPRWGEDSTVEVPNVEWGDDTQLYEMRAEGCLVSSPLHCTSIDLAKPEMMTVNAQPSVSAGNDANALHDSDWARYSPPKWDENTRVEVVSEDRGDVTQSDEFRFDGSPDLSRAPVFHPCDGITELLLKMIVLCLMTMTGGNAVMKYRRGAMIYAST